MAVAQTTVKENLSRCILDTSDDNAARVLKGHEPNEETVAAIFEGDELAKIYCCRFIGNDSENQDAPTAR
ncbi:MAG: hypothetical protein LBQ90_09470 [Synergistaceae bacterium]|nr:hypothetical protein [Synergistaceae bacterium]